MSLLFLAVLPLAFAFPPGPPGGFGGPGFPGGPMGIPPPPRELPPGFEAVLPADVVAKLKAIHEDDNMPAQVCSIVLVIVILN